MATTRLSEKALFVERGYGQVEPNHLSAQRTGQIYAQLPAAAGIKFLENGQFVKYNYADGVVDFAGEGEWMLVYNEVKVYRDYEGDNDFALIAKNYNARIYSPIDAAGLTKGQARNYGDMKDEEGKVIPGIAQAGVAPDGTANPFGVETYVGAKKMPEGTTMVPRVFKTNVGDIFTTNTIKDETLKVGDILTPDTEDGYLKIGEGDMKWQVVKVYTMPDHQQGVKIMRIA